MTGTYHPVKVATTSCNPSLVLLHAKRCVFILNPRTWASGWDAEATYWGIGQTVIPPVNQPMDKLL
jgi:hypothetical protein